MKDKNSVNVDSIKAVVSYKSGLMSGLIASVVSSIVLMIMTSIVLVPEFNFVLIEGSIFGLAETALSAWIVYFLFGLFWGYLYALIEPALPGNSPVTKGIIAGFLMWIIYMLVLMPLAGTGVFLKQYGFNAVLIILVVDLVFGIVLGYFYDRLRKGRE